MIGARRALRRGASIDVIASTFAFASLLACGDPLPDTASRRGDHVDYAWEATLTPCAGTALAMDRFVPFVRDQLGLDPAARELIPYTWLTHDEYHAWAPDFDRPTGGYFDGTAAYGAEPAIFHELVHAVDSPALGGRRFFVEGLAVAFDPALDGGSRYSRGDPRPYLTVTYTDDLDEVRKLYAAGGAFVAYLISRHGAARFLALHDRLGLGASEARIRKVFADVYERELDLEVEAFLGDACPDDASETPRPFACAGEAIAWATESTWFDARAITCEAAEAVGGHGDSDGESLVRVAVTVEIPEAGAYELRAFGDGHVRAILASCGRCPWLADDVVIQAAPTIVGLEAGRHALVYRGEARAVSLAGVQIVRAPEHDEAP